MNTMRINQFMIFLFSICGIAACREEGSVPQTVGFDEIFEIKVNEEVTVINQNDSTADVLTVKLSSLVDSRCPEGLTCIRAGDVQAEVEVSNGQQARELPMCVGVDCGLLDRRFGNTVIRMENDTASFTLSNVEYFLVFKEGIPYPKADGKKSEKSYGADRVVLEVLI